MSVGAFYHHQNSVIEKLRENGHESVIVDVLTERSPDRILRHADQISQTNGSLAETLRAYAGVVREMSFPRLATAS